MKNAEEALIWIINILRKHNIPFHIAGGFAAKFYGSERELADIDLDIPEEKFELIIPEVKEYIKYGHKQYKDDNWDLYLMTLQYEGQNIDIAGAYKSKLYNKNTKQWESARTDFSKDEIKEIFGLKVPAMNLQELVSYKSKIQRDVDIEDLKAITIASKYSLKGVKFGQNK